MSTIPKLPVTPWAMADALHISFWKSQDARAAVVLRWIATARAEGHAAGREEALRDVTEEEWAAIPCRLRHLSPRVSVNFILASRRRPVAPVEVFDERSG